MVNRQLSQFVRRLITASLAALLTLGVVTPAAAQADIDPRWGVLAEMAEKDFLERGVIATVRWETFNKVLVWTDRALLASTTRRFVLNSETGKLNMTASGWGGGGKYELLAQANGELEDQVYNGTSRFLWREAVDVWKLRLAAGATTTYRSLTNGGKASARLADLIAKGKVRAANPSLGSMAAVAAVRPPSVSIAQAVIPIASAPPISLPSTTFRPNAPRIALIIGNSDYGAAFGNLANPVNDADAMAAALTALGFKVELLKDVDQKNMKRAIARFGANLRQAGRSATGLFFYAGHGLQTGGINYLVPVNAAIEAEADVDLESVAADTVLRQMEEAGTATNIVILDACRNMPLARSLRSGTRGLARMEAPNGSFVAYSTAPGSVAVDGTGRNSPFVAALVTAIQQKGQPIETIFRTVRRSVLQATGGRQTPWDSSSLIDPFYFAGE